MNENELLPSRSLHDPELPLDEICDRLRVPHAHRPLAPVHDARPRWDRGQIPPAATGVHDPRPSWEKHT